MKAFYFINRLVYTVLQWTWGIIQNILGLILFGIVKRRNPGRRKERYHGAIVSDWKARHSMGLGMFIFFGHRGTPDADKVLVHEWGHTVQSMILGPLFLLVIGLPSVIWADLPCFRRLRARTGMPYTWLYCEKWANILGEKLLHKPAIWK